LSTLYRLQRLLKVRQQISPILNAHRNSNQAVHHPRLAEFLFGSEAAGIGSVALIPLTALRPPGLLALGSLDRERFHPGMSTEFLSRMAELIADALARP